MKFVMNQLLFLGGTYGETCQLSLEYDIHCENHSLIIIAYFFLIVKGFFQKTNAFTKKFSGTYYIPEVCALQKEIFLAVIVSIDTYLAAAAYCNSGIRIPALSAGIIAFSGAAVLGISAGFSGFLGGLLPPDILHAAGTAVLVAIGLLTVLKSIFRQMTKRLSRNGELSLKIGKSPLVVKIYLDDTAADIDHSKVLSAAEAGALALAGSLDSAAIGLGCGQIAPLTASLFTFICGAAALFLGNITGKRISALGLDLSWAGGVMLILFAFIS